MHGMYIYLNYVHELRDQQGQDQIQEDQSQPWLQKEEELVKEEVEPWSLIANVVKSGKGRR